MTRVSGGVGAVRQWLPKGGSLPPEEWGPRHAGIMILLWVNVLGIPLFTVLGGHSSTAHTINGSIGLGVLAGLGALPRLSRELRMACASLGLLSAATLLIHASGGLLELHFYFFVLVIVLTLYEDWTPFVLAIAFVLIHHGVLGTLDPRNVFDRPAEWADPWRWAGIHAAFVAAAGVAAIAAWRLNEDVRADMRAVHDQLEVASETDSLTGLGNRRRLMADLEATVKDKAPVILVILDLDGFKGYNDTFGHPAGDSLLARLGGRLQEAIGDRGRGYRLGGDEFCAIWQLDQAGRANIEVVSAAALYERGEGFSITAACGSVALPTEASSAESALQTADTRMYAHKHGSRASTSVQSRDVLLQALTELHPQLGVHGNAVTALVKAVAERLELAPYLVEQVAHAAQLHDIGKIAIPDAILAKPGRLDEQEWTYMHRHTVIGQRIVAAAPALAGVGALVRSSHERYDGAGYPDGLAGDDIPIGSRIIAVCDAFDAMTADRAYRAAMTRGDALAELRRCSPAQFDPQVLIAFEAALLDPAVAAAGRRAVMAPSPAAAVNG